MSGLVGARVVLTGASQGIGRALALELAARGARLALAARDVPRLEELAEACRGRGGEARVVPTDVADPEACRRLVAQAQEYMGGLDVLLLNAGIGMIARFEEVEDLGIFERLMQVNYLGPVRLTHAALPALRRSKGRIGVVASVAGLAGVPTRTGYAASKHAVIGFFDSLRVELRGSGVSITVVAPDFVRSEIHRRASGPDGRPLGKSPLDESRIMSAEECARRTLAAVEARRRLEILSVRGRLGRVVRIFAPGLIDRVAARAVERGR